MKVPVRAGVEKLSLVGFKRQAEKRLRCFAGGVGPPELHAFSGFVLRSTWLRCKNTPRPASFYADFPATGSGNHLIRTSCFLGC